MVIFSYTRAQAIADGVLVDVSELAKESGFRFPVAVTAGVWAECVAVPDGVAGQDETGRLWACCTCCGCHRCGRKDGERVDFSVYVRNDNREDFPPHVKLYALCGPGDDSKPVITVMLPHED